jgi:hypothetical protein
LDGDLPWRALGEGTVAWDGSEVKAIRVCLFFFGFRSSVVNFNTLSAFKAEITTLLISKCP